MGFETKARGAKRRSFRKVETDYYIPIYRRVAKSRDDRPNACRRSHSTRPPRRKRSRSTASRHATKPNAAANRHYPRNNQRPGGGRDAKRRRGRGNDSFLSYSALHFLLFSSFFFFSSLLLLTVPSFALQSRSFISRIFDYRNFFLAPPHLAI